MPYMIKKSGNKYQVVNKDTGKGHGLTTKSKATRQMRLLYSIENKKKK